MQSAFARPFDRNQSRAQFSTLYAKAPNKKILTVAELLNQASPEWLINGILPERALGVLYGPPDSYKSFVALDIALHVANGKPWHGRPVRQGNVLYVLGEGSTAFGRRVRAWLLRHDSSPDALNDVGFLPAPVYFLEDDSLYRLSSWIDQWKPHVDGSPLQLIVIDTLATCFVGGDETLSWTCRDSSTAFGRSRLNAAEPTFCFTTRAKTRKRVSGGPVPLSRRLTRGFR